MARLPDHAAARDELRSGVTRGPLNTLGLLAEAPARRAERPALLDLGPPLDENIAFFGELGFKVYVEDFLREYIDAARHGSADLLAYAPGTFSAVLCWDVLDYLPAHEARGLVERLFTLLRGGGVVLALFQDRSGGHGPVLRHRIRGPDRVDHEPAPGLRSAIHRWANREILSLFDWFETVKSYYHKNGLREYLFRKAGPG